MSLSTPRNSVRIQPEIPRVFESYCVPGAFPNDTLFPIDFNYINPPVSVTENDHRDATSQRFHVSNQLCVSMCCSSFDSSLDLGRLSLLCSHPKLTSVRSE
jgi:hypothetical protein